MRRRDRNPLNPQQDEVRLEPGGFALLRAGARQFDVRWDDVPGIVAFKRDLFAIDEIIVGFRVRGESDLF